MSGACLKHGQYDAWSCPTCDTMETIERESAKSRKDHAANNAALIEAQTRSTEEQIQAYQEAADRAEEATKEAAERAERTEEAIREGIEEQKRIARDSWKLEAESKVSRAIELLKSGLCDEAITLCKNALSKDPANIYGHLVVGRSLWEKDMRQEAVRAFGKVIQLSGIDQWNSVEVFNRILYFLPVEINSEIIDGYRRAVRRINLGGIEELLDFLMRLAKCNFHPEIENIMSRLSPERIRNLFENWELVNVLYQSESKKMVGTMAEAVATTISSNDVETWLSVLSWSVIIDRECGACPEPVEGSRHFEKAIEAGGKLIPDVGLELLQCFAKERGNLKNSEDMMRVTSAVSDTYSRMRDQIHRDFREKAEGTPYEKMNFSMAYLYGGLVYGSFALIATLISNPHGSAGQHFFNAFVGCLLMGWLPAIFIRLVTNSVRKGNAVTAFETKHIADETALIKECGLNINVTSDSAGESSRKS